MRHRQLLTLTADVISDVVCKPPSGVDPQDRASLRRLADDWTQRWYETGEAHYDEPEYAWLTYYYFSSAAELETSRSHVLAVTKFLGDPVQPSSIKPETILDFGAGIGLTTVTLALTCPDRTVLHYDVGERQRDVVRELTHRLDLTNVVVLDELRGASYDGAIALEVLEHIEEPMPVLRVLCHDGVKFAATSAPFGFHSHGHFDEYILDGDKVPGKGRGRTMRKVLIEQMDALGFDELRAPGYASKLWRNRMRMWRRVP